MAEALVNVLLERLATITIDEVGGEFKLLTEVEEEVKSLACNLEAIKAVLEDAEKRQVTDATVRYWLSELTEVSNDMDNVLDEWITRAGRRQMEKQEKRALATTEKVLSSASSFFSGSKVTRLIHRRDIAGRIKELNKKLALINERKQRFNFQTTIRVSEPPIWRETTSLPNVKPFGRDEEKSVLVSKLLSESSQETEVPLVIPIVGLGGMGKTTLAQLVFNDENVKSHFDKRIWVCVSDPFEVIKIAKAIIEGLDKDNTSKNSNELQTLSQCIYELIKDKKFLLVLDDVWSPKLSQWEELIKPFHNGAMGSRVLVTTRKEEVVNLMKATTQLIPMKSLGETFCLSLFYYSASKNESSLSKEFQEIGLQLVKRCNGLPLAAKTLGSLMRNKKNIHEWRDVLNSKTWELEEIQEDVFRPLLLSYHDLAPTIKCCLLYCVLFPKDYIYNMNTLIELWMAQDYLNAKGSKERIIVGQNYFNDLVRRSFFQDVEVDGCTGLQKLDVGRLINLRHLYIKGCVWLKLIKGIEKLTELQRLDEFRVGDDDEGNKFEHPKDLNQLQGSLDIVIVGNPNMAEKAMMANKTQLLQLKLHFKWTDEGESREIMNRLEPHQGLEKLTIYGYTGGAFSHWLSSSLQSLRVLSLEGCDGCELPPLGKLPSLESLAIRLHPLLLRSFKKVGVEFLGIDGQTSSFDFKSFPKLKQLTFADMSEWEEWEETSEDNITIMPCLSELTIHWCNVLKALPDFLWKTPLQKLEIIGSPILKDLYREETDKEWIKISHIPTINFKDE